jgi:hypothetical protein
MKASIIFSQLILFLIICCMTRAAYSQTDGSQWEISNQQMVDYITAGYSIVGYNYQRLSPGPDIETFILHKSNSVIRCMTRFQSPNRNFCHILVKVK